MSKESSFDWDKWIATSNYVDVIKQRPIIQSGRIVPTSICPNNEDILYINSIDEWLNLNDKNLIKYFLESIVRNYLSRSHNNNGFGLNALMLAQREYDFEVLCTLIQERFAYCDGWFDEEYEQTVFEPKDLFNEILSKIKG